MGAPELLHYLRGAGLVLTLTPAGGLHVAPRTALTDDHRAAIRTERDALVLALQAEAEPTAPHGGRKSPCPACASTSRRAQPRAAHGRKCSCLV